MSPEGSGSALPTGVAPGDIALGPANGHLHLRTFREGIAASVGHDLLLAATVWGGHLHVPAGPDDAVRLEVEVDLRSLEVLEGTGGVKPLSRADKAEIHRAMGRALRTGDHPHATFRSSSIRVEGDHATVTGELSLAGRANPIALDVRCEVDGTLHGAAQVVQTTWGIKPYTGLFGALKLRDAVDVDVEVRPPA